MMRRIVGAMLVLITAAACGGDDSPIEEGTVATAGGPGPDPGRQWGDSYGDGNGHEHARTHRDP